MNYDIIRNNLEKLEKAIKAFPDILGKYQKSENEKEKAELLSYASKLGLYEYTSFIKWTKSKNEPLIYEHNISFDELKSKIVENCIDFSVKELIRKKTQKGFITFLNSDLWNRYNGGSSGRRYNRKYFSENFKKSEVILANWIIQNQIVLKRDILSTYFVTEISNFESELNTELEITNDITKTIIRKIDTIKYDFRKLNFNLLKTEIENKIKERMLNVDKGEKLKCIEEQRGIGVNRFYDVDSYKIGSNGNLLVTIKDDFGRYREYNYRLFESVSKLRNENIENILSFLEE
jgi:hypothetical protein